ncbi:26S proteasome non-ATPase regulatory subunit 7 -like protein B [Capsicum chinense]|nr:26S proteasome non-ATPase regulatory subunit 7 -like protein B [Capsicum chinense]
MNIRKELWLQHDGSNYTMPGACYNMSKEEKKKFWALSKSVKFLDVYASNISREHKEELLKQGVEDIEEKHREQFPSWFRRKIMQLFNKEKSRSIMKVNPLAMGPDVCGEKSTSCIVNGVRYHIQQHDELCKSQNCGIVVRDLHEKVDIDFYVDMLNQLHSDDVEPITIGANVIELEAQIEYKVEVDYDVKDSDQEDDTMRYFFIIALLYLNLEDEVLIEEGGLQTHTLSVYHMNYVYSMMERVVAGTPSKWRQMLNPRLAKMDVIKSQQISSNPIEKVIVHPLVLLSIVDHYNRVSRDTRKCVVGVFLGTSFKGTVDVTDSYAVPFVEDDRDPSICTGLKLWENDLNIHGLFNDYVPTPVLVIIDVQPEELGIPTKIALMMLVIYLSLLIRSVIALNNLINNKMLNKEHKNAEDLKQLVVPTTAGS